MERVLTGIIGIAVILALALLLSTDRRAIRPRVVGAAFALQAAIAVLVPYTSWGRAGIEAMARGVSNLLGYANKGTEFLFGPAAANPLANTFALGALPVIIFFAALVSILYYLGVMQRVVRWVGGAIGWITGISRVEALAAAANIFVGQSESPLVIRPYLAALPPSRLFAVMVVDMAGVAGTILAAYAALLGTAAGVPWNEAGVAGGLFGTKIVLNEFVAFIDLGRMPAAALGERSRAIVTFALCGFANFSSIATQMAVTGGLAPNQRPMIAKLLD